MVIIYGAGMTGKSILNDLIENGENSDNILFSDSDPKLWNNCSGGVTVIPPEDIGKHNVERIIIGAAMGRETIFDYLTHKLLIPESLIEKNNKFVESYFRCYESRERFMKCYSDIVNHKKLCGSVAEGGVFEGRFSKVLSKTFPDRKLYLFDTFEGFDERDVICDKRNSYSVNIRSGMYSAKKTINEIVDSLEHPENVIVKKGYFPETANGVEDNFVFVNLDFDLYKPTIEGLRLFWPKLVKGGVILVHDYFNAPGIIEKDRYLGIRAAVDEFCKEADVSYIPIGDEMSVGFIK